MLADLPHFNYARRYVVPLLIIGAILAALGLGLTSAISAHANASWRLNLPIPRSLGFLGAAFLVAAGVVRRQKDGVRLLGAGALTHKLELTVHSASASARAAVEKAGGKLTVTRPERAVAETAAEG